MKQTVRGNMLLLISVLVLMSTDVFAGYANKIEARKGPLKGFRWNNCNTSIVPVVVRSFSILPDPVKVGNNISVSFVLEVSKEIGTTKYLQADLELTLTTQGTPIDLCRYEPASKYCHSKDLCKILTEHKCPEMIKELGTNCKCPFKQGIYPVVKANFTIPEVPIKGLFHAKVNLTEYDEPLGCIETDICIGSC